MSEIRTAMKEALDNAERIGYLKAQNQMLKFVVSLAEQGKISREVSQMFALEFTLDL